MKLVKDYKSINNEIHEILHSSHSSIVQHNDTTVENELNRLDNVVTSKSGKIIHINDSSNSPLKKNVIYGGSTQKTYTGKNLIENKFTSQIINGLTFVVNDDKSITVKGTVTESFNILIDGVILSAGDYIMNGGVDGGSSSTYQVVVWKTVDGETSALAYIVNSEDHNRTLTSESTIDYTIYFYAGTTINDITFKPMIRLATETDSTYEPYVGGIPSPNPDYPQDIISVGDDGSFTQKICGKNLFNIRGYSEKSNGITYTRYEDGTIMATGTATADSYYHMDSRTFYKANTSYIINGSPESDQNISVQANYFNDSGVEVAAISKNGEDREFTNMVSNRMILYINVKAGATVNNVLFKPMIREATVEDNTYEPYKEYTAELELEEPLRSLPNGTRDTIEYDTNGNAKIVRRVGEITFDGSDDEEWIYESYTDTPHNRKVILINNAKMCISGYGYEKNNTRCNRFLPHLFGSSPNEYFIYNNNKIYFIEDLSIRSSVSEWKTWLSENPITVYYELLNPVEEELSTLNKQLLSDLRTYDNYSTIFSDDTKAELEVSYFNNSSTGIITGDLQEQITSNDEDINRLENEMIELASIHDTDIEVLNNKSDSTLTAKGNILSLKDTIDAPLLKTTIYGKSEQTTYSGKNLFQPTKETITINNITCTNNGDGTYTLNGTSTDVVIIDLGQFIYSDYIGQDLILSGKQSEYDFYVTDNNSYDSMKIDDGNGVQFTVENWTEGKEYLSVIINIATGKTLNNVIVYPMIRLATIEDATWEPYVGGVSSPSPNYPQSINNVADSTALEVYNEGKNLCTFVVHCTCTFDPATGYMESNTTNNTITQVGLFQFYTEDGTLIEEKTFSGYGLRTYTFTKTSDLYTITVGYKADVDMALVKTTVNHLENGKQYTILLYQIGYTHNHSWMTGLMITEYGITDTTYQPPKVTYLLRDLQPLRSIPDGVSDKLYIYPDGRGKIIRNVGYYEFDGSESWQTLDSQNTENTFYVVTHYLDHLMSNSSGCMMSNVAKFGSVWGSDEPNIVANQCFISIHTRFRFDINMINSVSAWVAYLQERYAAGDPVYVYYPLLEPIEEELTRHQINNTHNLKTFNNITSISNSANSDIEIEYFKNNNTGSIDANMQQQIIDTKEELSQIGVRNYINKSTLVKGYIAPDGSHCAQELNQGEMRSDYIPVIPGEKYTITTKATGSPWARYCYYDADKNFISRLPNVATDQTFDNGQRGYIFNITIPDGVYYVRVTGRMYTDGTMKMEKGTISTDWIPSNEELYCPITTFTKTLSITTEYTDTGIVGSDLESGTYLVQLQFNDQPIFSGIIPWDNSTSFSADNNTCDIELKGLGYSNNYTVTLRLNSVTNSYITLQLKSSIQLGNDMSCSFKFKKMI